MADAFFYGERLPVQTSQKVGPMNTHARILKAINSYREETDKEPKALILDSFTHERLRFEHKDGPDDYIGTLKNFAGVEVLLLTDVVIL